MGLAVALAVPRSAIGQHGGNTAQAAAYHQQGIAYFQQGNYSAAASAFERAERLSHDRANLWNLARCYHQLGRSRTASRYLDRYLREPGLPPDRYQAAQDLRRQISSRGSGGSSLVGPWVLLGSGLAIALAGGVLDIVAYTKSQRDGSEPFGEMSEYTSWEESVEALALAGDLLLPLGAAAAVGGLVWLLVAMRRPTGRATSSNGFSLSLSPSSNGGLLLLAGRF